MWTKFNLTVSLQFSFLSIELFLFLMSIAVLKSWCKFSKTERIFIYVKVIVFWRYFQFCFFFLHQSFWNNNCWFYNCHFCLTMFLFLSLNFCHFLFSLFFKRFLRKLSFFSTSIHLPLTIFGFVSLIFN